MAWRCALGRPQPVAINTSHARTFGADVAVDGLRKELVLENSLGISATRRLSSLKNDLIEFNVGLLLNVTLPLYSTGIRYMFAIYAALAPKTHTRAARCHCGEQRSLKSTEREMLSQLCLAVNGESALRSSTATTH